MIDRNPWSRCSVRPSVAAMMMLCGWLLSPVPGQTVWRVDYAGGPGVHFTDLPPAVLAAQAGDTIMCTATVTPVPPGWVGYQAPVIDKPIRLVGLTVQTGSSVGSTTRARIDGVIEVKNIPAGQVCVVANLQCATFFAPTTTQGYHVHDCSGTVVLDGLDLFNPGLANQRFRIERCANVLIQGGYFTLAGSGVEVVDAAVNIQRSFGFIGSGWPVSGSLLATTTFPMLKLLRSTATVSDCTLRGHPGGSGPVVFGDSHPAVSLEQSTLNIGPYATLSPGSIFTAPPGYYAANPVNCLVRRDPRSVIPYQVVIPGLQVIHEPIHSTSTTYSVVADEPYTVWVDGPDSGFALLGLDQLLPAPAATPFGELWLDPFRFTPVAILPLAAITGEGTWNDICPAAAPIDVPFVFQSLTLAPDGTIGITLPSPFTVGWEYFRIP